MSSIRSAFYLVILLLLQPNTPLAESSDCDHPREGLGRECKNGCTTDSDCYIYNFNKLKCLCDGVCGKRCVDPNKSCNPPPKDIPNGRVTIRPYNKFGAFAKYTCNDGYRLVGLPARVCQGDGAWMGQEPRCQMVQGPNKKEVNCGLPPYVHHATHDGPPNQIKFERATDLRYRCHPGFVMSKGSVDRAWCVGGGVWVGPNLTCTASGCTTPENIPNGRVISESQNLMGSTVTYKCYTGYYLVGNENRICLKDGSWSGSVPSCETVVCGPPPAVEHAEHDGNQNLLVFRDGSVLNYHCEYGFHQSPGAITTARCNIIQGTWEGPNMTCSAFNGIARDCGPPGDILNGRRDPGYRFTYPTRVTYSCNDGYELRGSHYRECQANGEWSRELPECEPIHCPELGPPVHGTMIGSGTSYGSVIRFVCNDGFKVVGSQERECQGDRIWSGQDAVCDEIDCGVPGPLWNGYLDGHRTTVGAIYFYRCNLRTKFHGPSFSTSCMDNGTWSHNVPQCLGQCQVPTIINATILNGREATWVDHATVIKIDCLHGLVLNDSRNVTCVNGTWNVIPTCIPSPCQTTPPQVEHGMRIFFSVNHGARARYFCMAGYRLAREHRYLTCEYGIWKGTRPICEENYCENPGLLANGKIFKVGSVGSFPFEDYIRTIKHGDRLSYKCDRNFKLVGPRGAACVNGRWRPEQKPVCKPSKHPHFYKLWRPVEEKSGNLMY